MCGIAGWIDWERDLAAELPSLLAMNATLACRGPDAAATWLAPPAAFAHRRLVVVDPAGGGQPMVRELRGSTYALTYNGELYNTPELRQELASHGYEFRTRSDTEALLLAYVEWGPDCLSRLNGIFAFAIWDAAAQRLFLARDRLGVKPLFYARRGSAFLFASELKALLAHPLVEPVLDSDGLCEALVAGPARTPGHGVFAGVHELRPGHCLLLDRAGLRTRPYWRLTSAPHPDSLEQTTARVRELLDDAVQRQLVADVPVCTLLSGGLDSSAITAFAAAAFRAQGLGPVHTWSVDYAGNAEHFRPSAFQPDADTAWVGRVSRWLETVHHPVLLETEALVAALDPALRARDLPGMADVDSSLLLFCGAVKQEATVALSGECADEVFGGYPWFHRPELLHADTFPWSRATAERVALLAPELRAGLRAAEYLRERYRDALVEVPRLPGESTAAARRREMFYLNLTRFMPTLLDRKDRMSMAVGLEVRVPFCDHRLVEYLWNVPWEMKTAGGQEKGILRQALAGLLPDDVLHRRKSPYPKTHNPAYARAVRHRLLAVLDDPAAPLRPLIDGDAVRALASAEAPPTGLPWFGQLMGDAQMCAYLLQVNTWLQAYRVRLR